MRLLSACAVPAGSVQQSVARIGLTPSHWKVCVRLEADVVTESSIIFGAARLALWAKITSAAAFTLIKPQPNL